MASTPSDIPPEFAGATLRIDLDALAANYRLIRDCAAPARAAAVIKARGYGLGAELVGATLYAEGCRDFFVAMPGEAVPVLAALPAAARVFVLNGLLPGAEEACAALGAIPVLNSLDQIARWSACAKARGEMLPAAVQVDSGMSRLGLSPEELAILMAEPERLGGIDLLLVMSHLACADTPEAEANTAQATRFAAMAEAFPGVPRALDNSAGSFLPRGHFDLVRPGIALYGGAPYEGENPMRAVVSLEARLVQTRKVPAGTGVGYGLTHVTTRETTVATIPVGYADGWPRHLSGVGAVYLGGHRAPILGRVSMDSMTVDVTDVPEVHIYPGAPVELIGPHQSLDQVAGDAGTISYEILTQLGPRYHREIVPVQAPAQAPERSDAA
ncbi:alanine racemase [Novosphingobium sp. 9]|uniref:alanine racemase n=1 Tax=Novosphingobium sp. 9 TaxID=2025349 RepID=UPI0021B6D01B|nr:alanine racemase [Novosphingobium sp. 9]